MRIYIYIYIVFGVRFDRKDNSLYNFYNLQFDRTIIKPTIMAIKTS